MERATLKAPAMYADHHVLKAREAVLALSGVEDVLASAAWQTVIVSYDDSQVTLAAIQDALTQAGYGPDQTTPVLAESGEQYKDPGWETMGARATQTNRADLEMSGEFRKY